MLKTEATETIYTDGLKIHRGTITEISDKHGILVSCSTTAAVPCNFLRTSDNPMPVLKKGDRVMLTLPDYPGDRGCVLGIIESYSSKKTAGRSDNYQLSGRHPIKDEAVLKIEEDVISISANKGIAIKCGKGSITITDNGRISIDGVNLVNRARGVNKIKGGVVKIN